MRPAKIVAIVIGALLILIGIGLLVPGSLLLWLNNAGRDGQGFFMTSTRSLGSEGYALTTPEVDLGMGPGDWVPAGGVGTLRIRATSSGGDPVFIGIGPADEVSAYLDGVAHDEVTNLGWFSSSVEYRTYDGRRTRGAAWAADFLDREAGGRGYPDPRVGPAGWQLDRGPHERRWQRARRGARQSRRPLRHTAAHRHRYDRRRSRAADRGDRAYRARGTTSAEALPARVCRRWGAAVWSVSPGAGALLRAAGAVPPPPGQYPPGAQPPYQQVPTQQPLYQQPPEAYTPAPGQQPRRPQPVESSPETTEEPPAGTPGAS